MVLARLAVRVVTSGGFAVNYYAMAAAALDYVPVITRPVVVPGPPFDAREVRSGPLPASADFPFQFWLWIPARGFYALTCVGGQLAVRPKTTNSASVFLLAAGRYTVTVDKYGEVRATPVAR